MILIRSFLLIKFFQCMFIYGGLANLYNFQSDLKYLSVYVFIVKINKLIYIMNTSYKYFQIIEFSLRSQSIVYLYLTNIFLVFLFSKWWDDG